MIIMVLGFLKEEGHLPEEAYSMSWGHETPFYMVVKIDKVRKLLSGRPDYSLWYSRQSDLETNLVVVEAKTTEELSGGEAQLLGYMGQYCLVFFHIAKASLIFLPGLVHAGRTERKKEDTTVYGVLTDSITFTFYQISEKSKVSDFMPV